MTVKFHLEWFICSFNAINLSDKLHLFLRFTVNERNWGQLAVFSKIQKFQITEVLISQNHQEIVQLSKMLF